MVVIRRDVALSTPSLAMLAAGGASLLIATCLSVVIYVHYRNLRKLRMKMVADAKRAAIGLPVLQRAPEHLVDTSIDMSKMSHEMREQFAHNYRRTQASRSLLYEQHRLAQAQSSSQSSGSSSSSSGPIPTSSSDRSLHYQSTPSRPSMATQQQMRVPAQQIPRRPSVAVTEVRPTFAREKPVSRVAVPSALLRGLGDLPQMPEPGMGRRPSRAESDLPDMDCLTPEVGGPPRNMPRDISASSLPYAKSPEKLSSFNSGTVVCHTKRTTGGPAPVTVDYFSQIGRRALAPAQNEVAKQMPLKSCLAGGHSRSLSSGQSNKSPHKRPSFVLPPLPTNANETQAERKLPVARSAVSDFRPLSLGLVTSSNSDSLDAANLFKDMSHLLLFDTSPAADKPRFTSGNTARHSDTLQLHGKSIESMMRAFSPNSSRRSSQSSEASVGVDAMSSDAFDDAIEYAADSGVALVHRAEVRQSAIKVTRAIPTIILPPQDETTQLPFQTPHHHTLIPDQMVANDQRNSQAISPDLSQIHHAPLPPQSLPILTSGGSPAAAKPSFTSSLKAKLSLGRARSSSSSQQQQQQQRSVVNQTSMTSSDAQRRSAASSSVKSSVAGRDSYGPAVETWKVSTEDSSTPVFRIVPGPKAMAAQPLGLGLSDENGRNMDHEMANSPLFQTNDNLSPIINNTPWVERQASTQQTAGFAAVVHPDDEEKIEQLGRISYHQQREETLGTPPMRQIASPQFATMSHAPNNKQLGQTPTVIGSDWALNRHEADRSIHRQSVASSVCDTISSCMTGPSERLSMYDGRKAQDQRARLLEMIQQNKGGQGKRESQQTNSITSGAEAAGFVSHTATSPPSYAPPTGVATKTSMHKGSTPQAASASRKPVHLSIHPAKSAGDGTIAPHSAPLTPPHTPGDETPTLRSTRKVLAPAASVAEKTPTLDDPQFARQPKLRPLSLAIQQQQLQQQPSFYQHQYQQHQHQAAGTSQHAAINRFMTSSGSTSLHRSQYSSHSSSSRTSGSMTPIPSASSSITSISQHQHHHHHHHHSSNIHSPSRKRISLLLASSNNSPIRSSFHSNNKVTMLSRSGALPVGVLPTLPADASPSFITNNSSLRSLQRAS